MIAMMQGKIATMECFFRSFEMKLLAVWQNPDKVYGVHSSIYQQHVSKKKSLGTTNLEHFDKGFKAKVFAVLMETKMVSLE